MKNLFLALSLTVLCFSGVMAQEETEGNSAVITAKKNANTVLESMETICGKANKEAASYKESLPYQITAGIAFNTGIKDEESDPNNALDSFVLASKQARSAIIFCMGTNQLQLSKTNYDSALTKNVIMRLGDDLVSTNEDKLHSIFSGELLKIINRILGTLAILYIVILGMKYIMARGEDEDLSRYKTQFLWLILGLVVISLAEFVGFEVLNPSENEILNVETQIKLSGKVNDIIRWMQYAAGAFMLITSVITGYQLIIIGGGESANSLEKRLFKSIALGSGLILMSEVIVRILSFRDSAQKTTEIFVTEVAGLINFALSFVAIAAMAMVVLSSLYFVMSFGNEDQTTKAKRMIKTSILGVIISSASYVLVRFLIR